MDSTAYRHGFDVKKLIFAAFFALFAATPSLAQEVARPAAGDTMPAARRLAARVIAHLAEQGVRRPSGIFLLRAEPGREEIRVNFSQSNVPDAATDVRPIVGEFLERFPPDSFLEVSFRLGKITGLRPRPPADPNRPLAETQPRLRNAPRVAQVVQQVVRRQRHAGVPAGGPSPAQLRMLVDEEGEVVMVEVARRTGVRTLDDYLSAVAYEMRFTPAEIDGKPVHVYVTLPLTFPM
jgi:Gram-negative bacterial TonB protein C-terminal